MSLIPATKVSLRINLDESSVCLFQGDAGGNILVSKKRAREVAQEVPRTKRRCRSTHVGVICDRPDIQPLLPQVLIVNQRAATDAQMAALRAACPANVRIVRQKNAFTNIDVCVWLVCLLGIALRPFLDSAQPILLLDALRARWHARVLGMCRAWRLWPPPLAAARYTCFPQVQVVLAGGVSGASYPAADERLGLGNVSVWCVPRHQGSAATVRMGVRFRWGWLRCCSGALGALRPSERRTCCSSSGACRPPFQRTDLSALRSMPSCHSRLPLVCVGPPSLRS